MPKLAGFRIKFDKPIATYAPGETVDGRVVFKLYGPKNVREIRLKIRGKAKVHWTEYNSRYNEEYSKKERYFKVLITLAGEESGDQQITLLAGQHSYPFSFRLPDTIPCTFEHKYGYIRYTVKAVLDRPWKFDHRIISPFTVLVPYDLSIQRKFATPIDEDMEEEFFELCCFNAGLMKINVGSHTRGFSPGETTELIIKYDGSSTRVDITRMRLLLLKQITFYASSEKKRKNENLGDVYRTGPFGRKGEISLRFKVPTVPPSNLQHCSIIDVNYKLDFIIEFSGMYSNVTRSYPVQIWDTLPIP